MNTYKITYTGPFGDVTTDTVSALDAEEAMHGIPRSAVLEVECVGGEEEPCDHSDHDGHCCLICGEDICLADMYDEDYGKDR